MTKNTNLKQMTLNQIYNTNQVLPIVVLKLIVILSDRIRFLPYED